MTRRSKGKKRPLAEIRDYDEVDTTALIDPGQPLTLDRLGIRLPDPPPTQVISIRIPSGLLNEIRAISSERDIPYQALIKILLSDSVVKFKRREAA
jgi:hypothetical protein